MGHRCKAQQPEEQQVGKRLEENQVYRQPKVGGRSEVLWGAHEGTGHGSRGGRLLLKIQTFQKNLTPEQQPERGGVAFRNSKRKG